MSLPIVIYAVLLPTGLAVLAAGVYLANTALKTEHPSDSLVILAGAIFSATLLAGVGMFLDAQNSIHYKLSLQDSETATYQIVSPDTEIVSIWLTGLSMLGLAAVFMAALFLLVNSLDTQTESI